MSINIIFNAHFCKVEALLIELLFFYASINIFNSAGSPSGQEHEALP
jgi:hypothetical protein